MDCPEDIMPIANDPANAARWQIQYEEMRGLSGAALGFNCESF